MWQYNNRTNNDKYRINKGKMKRNEYLYKKDSMCKENYNDKDKIINKEIVNKDESLNKEEIMNISCKCDDKIDYKYIDYDDDKQCKNNDYLEGVIIEENTIYEIDLDCVKCAMNKSNKKK